MKIRIIFLLLTYSSLTLTAQIPYYDALELSKYFDGSNEYIKSDPRVYQILNNYIDPDKQVDNGTIEIALNASPINDPNPFLEIQSSAKGSDVASKVSSTLSNVGGLNVTSIADGLAKFLVNQGKNELNEMFFRRFRAALTNKKFEELKVFFPATLKKLQSIDSDIYQFKQYIPALRNAFEQDLSAIYDNLPKLISLDKYQPFFKEFPELKVLFESSFYIIDAIRSDSASHVGEIMADLDTNLYQYQTQRIIPLKNVSTSFRVLNIFSQSLQETQDSLNYWIKSDSLKKNLLTEDLIAFRIYLGLIYQQIPDTLYFYSKKDTLSVRSGLKILASKMDKYENNKDSIDFIMNFIKDFSIKAEAIDSYVRRIKNQAKLKKHGEISGIDYTNYYLLYNSVIDLLNLSDQIKDLPYLNANVNNPIKKYTAITSNVGDLYLNINQKEYVSAVLNITDIFGGFINPDLHLSEKIDELRDAKKDTLSRFRADKKKSNGKKAPESKSSIRSAFRKSVDSLKYIYPTRAKNDHIKTISKLKTYGTFMANVVKAEDSDAVEAALNAAASSSGGSSEKRNSSWNISLNGYIGADYLLDQTDSLPGRVANGRLGITAPIGFAFSTAFFKRKDWGTSVSLFVSLIDVGAIAQYRINDDTTAITSDIKLEHIVSPGINVVIGVPKTPISIGYGFQSGPILGRIEDPDNITFGNFDDRFRQHIFIAIDIPIFNLFTIKN